MCNARPLESNFAELAQCSQYDLVQSIFHAKCMKYLRTYILLHVRLSEKIVRFVNTTSCNAIFMDLVVIFEEF